MTPDTRTTPFLIDDLAPPPEGARLRGFAWAGADFVIGSDGLAAYEAHGRHLDWSADGHHVLTRRAGDRIGVGADFAGYAHLFHWSDGARWAVSDSFLDLVQHLRARGVALTEDPAQTGAFLSRKQLFQQLTSDRTAVREIRCLDAGARLEIDAQGLRVIAPEPLPGGRYEDALQDFLDLWLARLATLRADGRPTLRFHLSGGIDSRVVTAFHVHLARVAGPSPRAAIRSLDDAAHAGDLEIARRVAAAAGLPLNHPPERPQRPLSPDEALASWRITSAGAYSPLRLPTQVSHPAELHFSGHASSGYKVARSAAAARSTLRRMARNYGWFGRGDRARWRAQMEDHLARLSEGTGDLGRGLTRWHRVNRARFHGGQAASYKTQVAILHSRAAARAATCRPRGLPDYQFYHDILWSLAPEIAELPYDRAEKAPTAATRDHLTRVTPGTPGPGRVFGAFPEPPGAPGRQASKLDLLRRIEADLGPGAERLPRDRTKLAFRWRLRRLGRDLEKGRAPDPVKLRHLATAWLLVRLRELGVEPPGGGPQA